MRAMILSAGLGTRLAPLSSLCAKPAMPVMGLPLIAYLLRLLRRHGVEEVLLNLHHLPQTIEHAVERFAPPGLQVTYSREPTLLGTGGGIRGAARFLRESDPSLVLAGDMLLDVDLRELIRRHRARADRVTLLLRRDARAQHFGTIGIDADAAVRRIGSRFELPGATDEGLFMSARLLAARAFDSLPERDDFQDLTDWFAPLIAGGARDIRGELLDSEDCRWEPVGTPQEYLAANLALPPLSYASPQEVAALSGAHREGDVVLGAGAQVADGARLERAVVWENEIVPASLAAADGVFAAGKFHPCGADSVRAKGPEAAG
jgi:mannose-1-phosphate guanylyltransferase